MVAEGRMVFGMGDYISREDVLALAKDIIVQTKYGEYRHRCIDPNCVRELHAADVVERKRGSWWKSEDELGEAWMCSECLYEFFSEDPDFTEYVNYCPNCGSRMVTDGQDKT